MKIAIDQNAKEFILAKSKDSTVYIEIRRVSAG